MPTPPPHLNVLPTRCHPDSPRAWGPVPAMPEWGKRAEGSVVVLAFVLVFVPAFVLTGSIEAPTRASAARSGWIVAQFGSFESNVGTNVCKSLLPSRPVIRPIYPKSAARRRREQGLFKPLNAGSE